MDIATGQITIVDYNDAITLTGFISSNVAKIQRFNPDNEAYIPDWSVSPFCVLTPSLYKVGSQTDIITSQEVTQVKWYEIIGGTETEIVATTTRSFSGSKNHILTLKSNELQSASAKDYICVVSYLDASGLSIQHKMSISFGLVSGGSALTTAIALCPQGNVFKNSLVPSLTGECKLYRGSTIDSTNVSYQWYKQDSSVVVDEGGGIGWKRLSNTSGRYTGVTTDTITIYAAAITNIGVFKCIIIDIDSTSSTYNQKFYDTLAFIDNTDPVVVSIMSSAGNIFKNGVGSTTLTAKVFQAGAEIDTTSPYIYTYTWKKYLSDGTLDVDFSRTGKVIQVTSSDVDETSTFEVLVTK